VRKHIMSFKRAGLMAGVLGLITLAGKARAQQADTVFKIGVLPFVDNTGSGGTDLGAALSRAVQAEIAHSTRLQGRVIALDSGVKATAVDAPQAVAMGRADGVDVVMVGTVLEASSKGSNQSVNGPTFHGITLGGSAHIVSGAVTLQGDLYDVTSGRQIESIRVTGNASEKGLGANVSTSLGDLATGGNSFDQSLIGKALHDAVAQLVKRVTKDQSKMTHYTASPGSGTTGSQPRPATVTIDIVPGQRTIF